MFIGSAIETLGDEAPLPRQKPVGIFDMHASTPPVEAVLAAGYGEPHPFAPNGEQVDDLIRGLSQSPILWTGILYSWC